MLPKPKREKQQNQINITGKSNLSPSLSADAGFRSWLLTCAITCKITEVQAEDYNLIDVFGAKCAKITHVRMWPRRLGMMKASGDSPQMHTANGIKEETTNDFPSMFSFGSRMKEKVNSQYGE